MKLKTKMVNDRGDWSPLTEGEYILCWDLQHDAAVAHALVTAMDQWSPDEFGVVDALLARADELMREWGYGDE